MIWLGIIIGIVVMQLGTLIVIYVSNENDDVCMIFSIFLFFPFIILLQKIVIKIKDSKRKKRLTHQHEGKGE